MNRRFRLGAVERLRGSALAEAARLLGVARREVTAALTHREQLRGELVQSRTGTRTTPAEEETAAARRHRLREDLARAGERCTAAHSQELAAMAAWNAARADLRAVEMLHERHRLAVAESDARAEQRELDEFASLSHWRATDDLDPEETP